MESEVKGEIERDRERKKLEIERDRENIEN